MKLTVFRRADGGVLSKSISLVNGQVRSDGSACRFSTGEAWTVALQDAGELAALINAMTRSEALALGTVKATIQTRGNGTWGVVTRRHLNANSASSGTIARSLDFFEFKPEPGFVLIDFDLKAAPPMVTARIEQAGGLWGALCAFWPQLRHAAYVYRASTSSGLVNDQTGERYPCSGGGHYYLAVADVSDSHRCLCAMAARLWLEGLGWIMVSSAGTKLIRQPVDVSVGSPERLVFEGAPDVAPPLRQDARLATFNPGETLDTAAVMRDIAGADLARVKQIQSDAMKLAEPEAASTRRAHDERLAMAMHESSGKPIEACRATVSERHQGHLPPGTLLHFDDASLAWITVADVMADLGRFEGETLADPIDGVEYGRGKAIVMRGCLGRPIIHSLAHGTSKVFLLVYDCSAITAWLTSSTLGHPELIVEAARRIALSNVDEVELVLIVDALVARTRVGKRQIQAAIKNARARMRAAEAASHREETLQGRVSMPLPANDAPLGAICEELDRILAAAIDKVPPFRDGSGQLAELIVAPLPVMHQLNTDGTGPEAVWHIAQANETRTSFIVEQHVCHFRTERDRAGNITGEREAALQQNFCRALASLPNSSLPRVHGVVVLPMVDQAGQLIHGDGLIRELGIIMRVPAPIASCIPNGPVAVEVAKGAYKWLTDEWLFDVATDEAGKAACVAAALTIIEREMLEGRPGFSITAGARGGGKSITAQALAVAVTGATPPATAWSPEEEERRKAVFALGRCGASVVVWDNLKNGSTLSCPVIDRVLTTGTLEDRVLGQSKSETVSARFVMLWTGNNIAMAGDISSRMINIRLETDRPDPENRNFKHPDFIAWTREHRGAILSALFSILLVDRSRGGEQKSRFKPWWTLVGEPIEIVSSVDLARHIADGEAEDLTVAALAELFDLLIKKFPPTSQEPASQLTTAFGARAIAGLINEGTGGIERQTAEGEDLEAALTAAAGPPFVRRPVTSKAVAKKLLTLASRVAMVDDRSVKLLSLLDRHKKQNVYWLVCSRGVPANDAELDLDSLPQQVQCAAPKEGGAGSGISLDG